MQTAVVTCDSLSVFMQEMEIYANLVFKDLIKRRPGYLSSPPLFSLSSPRFHL